MSTVYSEIEALFTSGVSEEYLGEDVKLVEHMLQCAALAREAGATDELVVASLLHDIGHLLIPSSVEDYDSGVDAHHDEVGAAWVAERFPESVSEPVRLHVEAKQYLVATNPSYLAKLSIASQKTLEMQGGVFSAEAAEQFIKQPWAKEGVQLRIWDDDGKVRNKDVPGLGAYREAIVKLAG
jgi:gamma-butyrobetaine dioxygenase